MSKVKALVYKEVMDILRDKKTLITMIVVPILLYPLILIGMTMMMSMFAGKQEESVYTIEISAEHTALAQELERLYEENREDMDVNLEICLGEDVWADSDDEAASESGGASLEIIEAADGKEHIEIHYDSATPSARYAATAAEDLVELYRDELLGAALKEEGLDEEFLHPVTYETVDHASATESFAMDMGGSIGMLLIVTILLGAVYPAIDATAGEKERGTLETLLTLPVTNFQMILSKFLSVSVFACVTAVVSLLSLGGSVVFLMQTATKMQGEVLGLDVPAMVSAMPMMLLTMITTALLATALCMCFCIFAKSFKEANNYITPVLLVVMFASMVSMVPTVKLDYRTAVIPIVNVSLLVKQMISGQLSMSLAAVANVVNAGYSILLIWILAKLYHSEDILFADGFRSVRLFGKREDMRPGTVPAAGDLLIVMTLVFLLNIYGSMALSGRSILVSTAAVQAVMLIVPLLCVWYMKSDVKSLFSMKKPKLAAIPGSVFLYFGTFCIVLVVGMRISGLFQADIAAQEAAFEFLAGQPLAPMLLVTAVLPGFVEELLFRGFLFGSLRRRFTLKRALVISALVFGVFHMSLVKLLPTALLGAAFAYIVAISGSIYVTMILHALNNAMAMLIIRYQDECAKIVPILAKEELTGQEIALLLQIGALLAAIGIWLLRKTRKEAQ